MLAIELAGPRGMVGVRMIPAYDVEPVLARGFLRFQYVLGGHRKAIARRILAPIDQRKKLQHLARRFRGVVIESRITSEQRAATLVWEGLSPVLSNAFRQFVAQVQLIGFCVHSYSSSQNRSLKYFAAESAKTVT